MMGGMGSGGIVARRRGIWIGSEPKDFFIPPPGTCGDCAAEAAKGRGALPGPVLGL